MCGSNFYETYVITFAVGLANPIPVVCPVTDPITKMKVAHTMRPGLKGWRTSPPCTFQPQASTLDLSTPDFSNMNFSTLDFSTMNFWTMHGVEKFMVKKSGVEMSSL